MPKRLAFLLFVFALVFLVYKIGVTEYQSLRAQARMQEYEWEIQSGRSAITFYKRRLARNDTVAHRVLQKKKTGNIKLPAEEVVIFSEAGAFEVDEINLDEIFRVELDLEQDAFYDGLSIPQRWNKLLFGY